jgi:hypothetical protein
MERELGGGEDEEFSSASKLTQYAASRAAAVVDMHEDDVAHLHGTGT